MTHPWHDVRVVLLAGGRGERFWPRSTEALPKQFLQVDGKESLIRATFARAAALTGPESIYVVTQERYADLVRQELPALPEANLILEPCARNTAAALGLAARRLGPDAILVAMPSDHHITGPARFRVTVQAAVEVARHGYLVTIGIPPTRPETGYGYIRRGAPLELPTAVPAFRVDRFTEKPERATAEQYLQSGEYAWNSGILVARAGVLDEEIGRHMPELHAVLERLPWAAPPLPGLAGQFAGLPGTSIDKGVLERSDRVAVVPGHFGWNDVGDWAALSRLLPLDENGNAVIGEVLLQDSRRVVVHGGDRLVVLLGVSDLIVVDTPKVLLVCAREKAQEVRQVARIGAAFADALFSRGDAEDRRGGPPCPA
ncbi:MAG: sugar phosphate nucleotidyltransferase [Symbiobacterium sp.]|uniref:mannose-1-phosphate guanylyltransferase n=1 Tax=Symbiobacterium sp. TaxID=1971213 RepID=UPI003463AEDD